MIEVPIQRLLNWRLCENLLVLHHVWLSSNTFYHFYYTCYLMYLLSTALIIAAHYIGSSSMFWSISWFSQPNRLSSVKSREEMLRQNVTKILWQQNNASWSRESEFCNNASAACPFDPHYYEKPRHATGIVMETSDILNWEEVFTVRILLLSSYLRYSESSQKLVF